MLAFAQHLFNRFQSLAELVSWKIAQWSFNKANLILIFLISFEDLLQLIVADEENFIARIGVREKNQLKLWEFLF